MSIQQLKSLPTNDFAKAAFANKVISQVNDGEINPLEVLSLKKHIEDILERIANDPDVVKAIDAEMDKYNEKEVITNLGYKIERASRKNWDYSTSGDSYLEQIKKDSKVLADKVKEREKFLQSLKQRMFDSENGGFEIAPPSYTTTSYFKLTAQKQGLEVSKETGLPF